MSLDGGDLRQRRAVELGTVDEEHHLSGAADHRSLDFRLQRVGISEEAVRGERRVPRTGHDRRSETRSSRTAWGPTNDRVNFRRVPPAPIDLDLRSIELASPDLHHWDGVGQQRALQVLAHDPAGRHVGCGRAVDEDRFARFDQLERPRRRVAPSPRRRPRSGGGRSPRGATAPEAPRHRAYVARRHGARARRDLAARSSARCRIPPRARRPRGCRADGAARQSICGVHPAGSTTSAHVRSPDLRGGIAGDLPHRSRPRRPKWRGRSAGACLVRVSARYRRHLRASHLTSITKTRSVRSAGPLFHRLLTLEASVTLIRAALPVTTLPVARSPASAHGPEPAAFDHEVRDSRPELCSGARAAGAPPGECAPPWSVDAEWLTSWRRCRTVESRPLRTA